MNKGIDRVISSVFVFPACCFIVLCPVLFYVFTVNDSVPTHVYTSSTLLLSVFAVNGGVHIPVVCCEWWCSYSCSVL